MPLPFDFQGKGVFDFASSDSFSCKKKEFCYVGIDGTRSSSPPTSSSTLSSSRGGGSTGTVTGVAGNTSLTALECGFGSEDWGSVLPSQEQSILRMIMGDIGDQSMEINGGFGMMDQGFGFGNLVGTINPCLQATYNDFNVLPVSLSPAVFHPMQPEQSIDQNSSLFQFPNTQVGPNQVPKVTVSAAGDELAMQQFQQGIIEQLFKSAELIETGNTALAQGILARLNHQLFPIGKPLQRAAYYFKEALQLLLQMNNTNSLSMSPFSVIFKISAYKSFSEISPVLQFANFTSNQAILDALDGYDKVHILDFNVGYGEQWASLMQEFALRNGGPLLFRITAFASPSTHDELELGFAQESLHLFASELNMAFEFEIVNLEFLNSGSWPLPFHGSENEAIAVNLPISSFLNCPVSLPLVLGFVKQVSPKIVVSVDRGCDRTDVPFPHHVIHAFQSYSSLLESIDAVNVNLDAMHKIERFLLQPCIEKIVLGRHNSPERTPPWRNLFSSCGFTPLAFSNIAESQAECLVQRTAVWGFHIEKRQFSLVLCWQGRELISVAAWRC